MLVLRTRDAVERTTNPAVVKWLQDGYIKNGGFWEETEVSDVMNRSQSQKTES